MLVLVISAFRTTSQARRIAKVRLEKGVTLTSRFDSQGAHFGGPYLKQSLPYRAFTAISVKGDWVFLSTRGAGQATVLPLALFPDRAIDRIRFEVDPSKERISPTGG